MPDLDFHVEGADVLPYAAVPTLTFAVRIQNADGEPVRSVALKTQIRILAARRSYSGAERERLRDLYGEERRWGETLRPLLWANTSVLVPPFNGETVIEMPVPCTYDFDVVSAKYFNAVDDGEIPLEFLFSGSVFYDAPEGLRVTPISWEKEARYQLAANLWRRLMDTYFPNSAWLRLRKDVFDHLAAFKTGAGLTTWEDAVERLLDAHEEGVR